MEGKGNVYELEEEVMDRLLEVSEKRKEMPKKCANLVAENLSLQQSLVENSIILPGTEMKKLACKYSLKEPLKKTFNLPTVHQSSIQHISLMISKVKEEHNELNKIIKMYSEKGNQ